MPATLACIPCQSLGVIYNPGFRSSFIEVNLWLAAAGCVYCQHHNRFGALRAGLPAEQLDAIWDYENAEGFTPAQRVALRVAHHASLQPNQVSDEDFSALREHYPENACAEIVAVIALFGFLNRWNDTIKTESEELPPPAKYRTDKG